MKRWYPPGAYNLKTISRTLTAYPFYITDIDILGMQPPLASPEKEFERIDHNSQPKVFTAPQLAIEMSPKNQPQQHQQKQSAEPRQETVDQTPIIEEIPPEDAPYADSPGMINVDSVPDAELGWVSKSV